MQKKLVLCLTKFEHYLLALAAIHHFIIDFILASVIIQTLTNKKKINVIMLMCELGRIFNYLKKGVYNFKQTS